MNKYLNENLAEAWNELGPTAVNVFTGKRLFPNGKNPFQPVNTAKRERAAVTLNQINEGDTVSFPYGNVLYTAVVNNINITTATVTVTRMEDTTRSKKITVGSKIRVSAGILARSV